MVNLALQGGGSHGAFTWGVLDRLLEDGRIDVDGISGTSAGAMNGAVLAYGLAIGDRQTARDLLETFWRRVASQFTWGALQPSLFGLTGNANLEISPLYAGFDVMMRVMSPYQFNPLDYNPLREILNGVIDFTVLREVQMPRLYVSATNVTKGKLRVFAGADVSVEALIASSCLPFLWQAVEIEGESYWDGGYMGNPTLYPLIHACESRDILVVQINPMSRDTVPMTPTAIVDRMNEVSFNSTFLREARALELINRLIQNHRLDEQECGLRSVFLHLIGDERGMAPYTVSSKLNTDYGFIRHLRDLGRAAADQWLDQNFERIGRESTFTVDSMLA